MEKNIAQRVEKWKSFCWISPKEIVCTVEAYLENWIDNAMSNEVDSLLQSGCAQ